MAQLTLRRPSLSLIRADKTGRLSLKDQAKATAGMRGFILKQNQASRLVLYTVRKSPQPSVTGMPFLPFLHRYKAAFRSPILLTLPYLYPPPTPLDLVFIPHQNGPWHLTP